MKLERIRFFPHLSPVRQGFKHQALIGVGGNIGDVKRRFRQLYRLWKGDPRLHLLASSPILRNPPFGYLPQAMFYNAVMMVQTSLHVKPLLRLCLHTEKRFRRKRGVKNGPRTLDLDIIVFDNLKRHDTTLHLPHPYWQNRPSVVIPLMLLQRPKKG